MGATEVIGIKDVDLEIAEGELVVQNLSVIAEKPLAWYFSPFIFSHR